MDFVAYVGIIIALMTGLLTVISIWNKGEKDIGHTSKAILSCIFAVIVVLVIVTTYNFLEGGEEGGGPTEPTPPPTSTEGSTGPEESTPPATKPPVTETTYSPEVHIGDTITFGTYEQDGDSSNRQEPIEWVVLDKADNKVLVLSTKALDCQPYNKQDTGCTWATCSLRKWLNGTFYKTAFSSEDRERIVLTDVAAHENPDFSTNPGMSTEDYIFLLSVDEVNQYLPYDGDRMCSPTEYAKEQGGFEKKSLGTCWWWLRTPGETSSDACSINSNGTIDTDDGTVSSDKGCVRPAMWLHIGE